MMMKSVLFLFHSNSDYLIEHLQDFIFYGVYALLSLLLAVPAWFVVMAGMKNASEKKRLLVATLVAVLVATLADVFFLCFLGDMISGFVYDVLLSNIIFTSF